MGGKLRLLLAFAVLGVASSTVTINGGFEEGFGWKVNCSWTAEYENQHIDSVTISRNDEKIIELKKDERIDGLIKTDSIENENYTLKYNCINNKTNVNNKIAQGYCEINVTLTLNPTDDLYKVQIGLSNDTSSMFINETKDILDSPSKVNIQNVTKSGEKLVLNCTAEGVPPPVLEWTSGEDSSKKVVEPSSNDTIWNKTTKRWLSWSVFNVTDNNQLLITCNSYQDTKEQRKIVGPIDKFNYTGKKPNSAGKFDAPGVLALALLVVAITTKSNIL